MCGYGVRRMMREQILLELQMLTGILSDDIEYLFNEFVHQDKEQHSESEKVEFLNDVGGDTADIDVDSWFDKL